MRKASGWSVTSRISLISVHPINYCHSWRQSVLSNANQNRDNPDLRANYIRLRNKVTRLIRKTKSTHFCKKVNEYKNNPKLLWKQFKSLGYSNKSKEKSRIILDINNEKCFDPTKVVNEIAKYFLTVAENLVRKIPNVTKIFDVNPGMVA